MCSISIIPNYILNSPINNNINLMEEKGDTLIMSLLNNLLHNAYRINSSAYMFTQPVPINKSDFDNMFYNFKESVKKNIEFCSLIVWNKLKNWLGREVENASYNAYTASFECKGYSEKAL